MPNWTGDDGISCFKSSLISSSPLSAPENYKDLMFTPLDRWRPWHQEFKFTIDVCGQADAPVSQAIGRWYGIEEDGLARSWAGERVWVNMPYSNIGPWVAKAWENVAWLPRPGEGAELVALLLPGTRTEQPWFQKYIEPYREKGWLYGNGPFAWSVETRFLGKRIAFGNPIDPTPQKKVTGVFNSVLVIMRRRPL